MRNQTRNRIVVILGVWLCLAAMGLAAGLLWPPLDTKAGATLPAREVPAVTDKDDDDDSDRDDDPVGAYIELQTPVNQPGLWSVVQWQDSNGDWHDVEGWRGTLDGSGLRRWWVDAKDFGDGPFRWNVYGLSGELQASSAPFSLPTSANEIQPVSVSWP